MPEAGAAVCAEATALQAASTPASVRRVVMAPPRAASLYSMRPAGRAFSSLRAGRRRPSAPHRIRDVAAPLPPTVKTLGLVSLLTDASSEMIYPLLPAFLTGTLKAGPAFLGLVEGAAEAAASLLKLVAGWLSDRWNR